MKARGLARIGTVIGLVFAAALTARVVQVQVVRPGGAGVGFIAVYASLLFLPFAVGALGFAIPRAARGLWIAAGCLACMGAFALSLAGVALPFLIPGVMLIVAGASADAAAPRPRTAS